jgi:DNA invertase Pin-like site-specific DNA recombinase
MAARKQRSKALRRAGIYVRISKDRDDQLSTQVQEESCRAVCAARGYDVVDVYSDVGKSAYKVGASRPAFDRLRDDVAAGNVDVVVAYKLDRVARSSLGFARFVSEDLTPHGADLVLSDQPDMDTTAAGGMLRGILAVFAEFESAVKGERISGAMAHKAREGRAHAGGTRLYGYTVSRDALIADEARNIRAAAKKVLAGASLSSIARDWNERGLRTPPSGKRTPNGTEWRPSVLGRLLRNEFLAGLRNYDGAVIVGTWPKVFDVETHEQLVAVLSDPERRSSDSTSVKHLLAGFVVCGLCGERLVSRPHRKHGPRYLCATGPGRKGCGKIAANVPLVDEVVGEWVVATLTASAEGLRKAGSSAPRIDVHALEAEAAQIVERQRELAREWARRTIDRAEWMTAREVLEERADEIERDLRVARNGKVPTLPRDREGMSALWDAADVDERRTLVRLALHGGRVVIGPGTRGRWNPDRVEVVPG